MTPIDSAHIRPPRTALLLLNDNARRGRESGDLVRQLMQRAGIATIEPTAGMAFVDAIRAHAAGVDCVIVGGGDGTLGACVDAIAASGLPMGVLPLGTANDFARSLGIPVDLASALGVIARAHAFHVDLGVANGHAYLNVASVGFSAELAAALTAENKKRWGKLGYAITAAKLLAGSKVFDAAITHDGAVERFHTFQVSVGNGRFYGGGMTVHNEASPMDGMLDVYSLEIDHWWKLLRLLPALRKGTHGQWNDVRAFSSKALHLETGKPLPVNLDGELKTTTPVTFEIRENALKVYMP
ncbi:MULTISPECIES: lipid kinase [Luteimonas]|uniref:lipid kinase n=1 Tax=Luteimonas TaxID=83614 RepID=UPI000C7B6B85|nr:MULTISPECIES: lipid kinase [Luteimonas]